MERFSKKLSGFLHPDHVNPVEEMSQISSLSICNAVYESGLEKGSVP